MRVLLLLVALLAWFPGNSFGQSGYTRLGEFRVNTTTAGTQISPRMAGNGTGDIVVVWTATGGIADGQDVFAQRYNVAGSPVGSEFRVNTATPANQTLPSVGMAPDGRFVVVWYSDGTADQAGLFFRRYGANGTALDVTQVRVPIPAGTAARFPDVAVDGDGNFIVAWGNDGRQGDGPVVHNIYAQRYTASGTPAGSEIFVNDQDFEGNQTHPSVACASDGRFVIVWRDNSSANVFDARGRLYTAGGTPAGNAFPVHGSLAGNQVTPAVAMGDDGGFVVAWDVDRGGGNYDVVARRFSAAGVGGIEIPVNTSTNGAQFITSVALRPSGEFLVVFASQGFDGNGSAVAARRFSPTDVPIDANEFLVNTFTAGDQSGFVKEAAYDADGNFVIVWTSIGQDGDQSGIYAEKFYLLNQGPPLREFRVNTTTRGNQREVSVAANANGGFAFVWLDEGVSPSAIRRQQYTSDGLRIGGEELVTNAGIAAAHAMNASGDSVVVWQSPPPSSAPDIFARRYTAGGAPLDMSPIQVTSEPGPATAQVAPAVAIYPDGRFVVVWAGVPSADNSDDIHGQLFGADGVALSGQFRIDQASSGNQDDPDVALLPDGGFVVAWGDSVSPASPYQPMARIYDVSGGTVTARSNQFALATGGASSFRHPVSVAVDGAGRIIFVWESENEGTGGEIFGRRFSSTTAGLSPAEAGPIFMVNSTTTGSQKRPSVDALANGDFIVTWCSDQQAGTGNGFDLFVKRFRPGATLAASLSILENERRVNDFVMGEQGILSPEATALRGRKKVAYDSLGNYVIGWHSQFQDGDGYGIFASERILATPPSVTTLEAVDIGGSAATLRAAINPNGQAVTLAFEYDTQASFLTANVVQGGSFPPELSAQSAEVRITGLARNETYYFRAKATVGAQVIFGSAQTFATANAAPVINGEPAFFANGSITIPVSLLASDPDGDAVTAAITPGGQQFGQATASANGLAITYKPASALQSQANGDTFNVSISDGSTPTPGTAAGAVRVYSFNVFKGDYVGLIKTEAGGVDGTGTLDIKVTATGQATYKLIWQGQQYSGKGQVDRDGTLRLFEQKLPPTGATLDLTLTLKPDPSAQLITGSLVDSGTIPASTASAELVGTATVDQVEQSEVPAAGVFTATIFDPDAGAVSAAPESGATVLPRGIGFTTVSVGKGKRRPAKFVGQMPDAQKFSSGVAGLRRALLSAASSQRIPSYRLFNNTLYGKNTLGPGGVVEASVGFERDTDTFSAADVNWQRGAGIDNRFEVGFRTVRPGLAGFHAMLYAIRYGRPRAGSPPDGFSNSADFRFNALLTFRDGDLGEFSRKGRLYSSKTTIEASTADPSVAPKTIKMSVKARGGTFSGSFIHPADAGKAKPKPTKFSGVFQTVGDNSRGVGVFIGVDPATVTTSGSIEITPNLSDPR